ncbi:MAG TPA: ATP-binding protein [Solirubrobacteraceae bacterium]|nr:ATP-binding protein [Solirubrobacteraceae bacterium]
MEAFSVETDIPGGPQAAWRAREIARRELEHRVAGPLVDDVALLLTELVANGVRHGGGVEGTELRIRLESRPPALHVEVVNPDHALVRIGPRDPDLDGGGGLGLHIVDRVSNRWGVRDGPPVAVWFELDALL